MFFQQENVWQGNIPVRSNRLRARTFKRACHLWLLKFLIFWASSNIKYCHVWTKPPYTDRLKPSTTYPLLERSDIGGNRLVWCDTYVERVRFHPSLKNQPPSCVSLHHLQFKQYIFELSWVLFNAKWVLYGKLSVLRMQKKFHFKI